MGLSEKKPILTIPSNPLQLQIDEGVHFGRDDDDESKVKAMEFFCPRGEQVGWDMHSPHITRGNRLRVGFVKRRGCMLQSESSGGRSQAQVWVNILYVRQEEHGNCNMCCACLLTNPCIPFRLPASTLPGVVQDFGGAAGGARQLQACGQPEGGGPGEWC